MQLFKRSKKHGASWYVVFMVKGRRYQWCTKTADEFMARRRAELYRERLIEGKYHLADAMKTRNGSPRIEQVVAEYLALPVPVLATRNANVAALRAILRAGGHDMRSRVDVLDKQLILKYQDKELTRGISLATVRSMVGKARSLFARVPMEHYSDAVRPHRAAIEGFLQCSLRSLDKVTPRPPDEGMVARAHTMLEGGEDRGLWRAYLLARYGGLRAGEIIAARKSWLKGNAITIGDEDFVPKSGKQRTVNLDPYVVSELLKAPGESLIDDHPTVTVRRALPLALKAAGFDARTPTHSLRRLFGSVIYTEQGPAQAKIALGHSDQKTTDDHYASYLSSVSAVPYRGAGVLGEVAGDQAGGQAAVQDAGTGNG